MKEGTTIYEMKPCQWQDEFFCEMQIGDQVFWRNAKGATQNGKVIERTLLNNYVISVYAIESETKQKVFIHDYAEENLYLGHNPQKKEVV